MNKNLIMTMGSGYSEKELAPFFNSLQKCEYQGDIYVITREQDQEAFSNFSQAMSIKFHFYQKQKPLKKKRAKEIGQFIDAICTRSPIVEKLSRNFRKKYAVKNSHFLSTRFFWLQDILSSCPDLYQNIMLSDIRDVVFQRDPFDFNMQPKRIYFFLEAEHIRIQDCPWNASWLKELLGTHELDRLGHNFISCAGTTLGSREDIQFYLDKMTEIFLKNLRCCNKAGIDQATHNFILWDQLIPNIKIIPNRAGVVLTMHYTKREHWSIREDGLIVVDGNKTPNIIHQYDRHPDATKAILARYT